MTRPTSGAQAVAAFLALGLVVETVVAVSAALHGVDVAGGKWSGFPGAPWLDGWTRWDGGWYWTIARDGYALVPGRQSSVAFFPFYPLLMWLGGRATGTPPLAAGIALTVVSSIVAIVLFRRWAAERSAASETACAILLAYPFSFFLYGVVYSDALFLALALAAFTLLEKNRPLAAGLVAALATATRPVGVALAAGLALRALERRGVLGAVPSPGTGLLRRLAALRIAPRELAARDLGILLAPLGLAAYCAYLEIRFGDPIAFVGAVDAPGWDLHVGPATWLKLSLLESLSRPWGLYQRLLLAHAAATLVAFAFVPAVIRRFGLGYGLYALAALAIPAVSSKDLFGMGRYVLAAFPCFAVAGELLAERPRLAPVLLAASFASLLLLVSLFARWEYVS